MKNDHLKLLKACLLQAYLSKQEVPSNSSQFLIDTNMLITIIGNYELMAKTLTTYAKKPTAKMNFARSTLNKIEYTYEEA